MSLALLQQAPAPPARPDVFRVPSQALGTAPMSGAEVRALQARRRLLSDQLQSADSRRKELSNLARNASGADKAGLDQRIGVLDERLARLERDIDETGRLLASTPATLASTSEGASFSLGTKQGSKMADVIPIIAILSVFVLFPIAISIARNIWRRGSRPAPAPMDRETAQRLERMEQAMDAIAIEVERVSEGQRFVTRLLGERQGVPLGAAERTADAARLSRGEQAGV